LTVAPGVWMLVQPFGVATTPPAIVKRWTEFC
jgi:hypothetical protein